MFRTRTVARMGPVREPLELAGVPPQSMTVPFSHAPPEWLLQLVTVPLSAILSSQGRLFPLNLCSGGFTWNQGEAVPVHSP